VKVNEMNEGILGYVVGITMGIVIGYCLPRKSENTKADNLSLEQHQGYIEALKDQEKVIQSQRTLYEDSLTWRKKFSK